MIPFINWFSENLISLNFKPNGLQSAGGMGGFETVQLWLESAQEKKKTPQGMRGCFSHIFATQISDMAMRAGA